MHVASSLMAAGVVGAAFYLMLKRVPPWRIVRLCATKQVRLLSWDEHCRRADAAARAAGQRRSVRVLLVRHGQSMANVRPELVGGRDVSSPLSSVGETQAKMLGERLKREGERPSRVFASHAVRAQRTAELACATAGITAGIEIETEPRVVEFSQGALEKQRREDVYREGGTVMREIARDACFFRPPGHSPDGDRGESQHDVEMRFAEWMNEVLRDPTGGAQGGSSNGGGSAGSGSSAGSGGSSGSEGEGTGESSGGSSGGSSGHTEPQLQQPTILVFSHGIAIRSFLRGVLRAGYDFVIQSSTDNTSITELIYSESPGPRGGWRLVRLNDTAHLTYEPFRRVNVTLA